MHLYDKPVEKFYPLSGATPKYFNSPFLNFVLQKTNGDDCQAPISKIASRIASGKGVLALTQIEMLFCSREFTSNSRIPLQLSNQ